MRTARGGPPGLVELPWWRLRGQVLIGLLLVVAGAAVAALGLDAPWLLAWHRHAPGPAEVVFWSSMTVLGLGWCALILVLAADRGDGRLAALLIPAFVAGTLFTHLPKRVYPAPRPAGTALEPQLHVIGQAFRGAVSMPSGHALTAFATAALLAWSLRPEHRRAGTAGLFAVAAVIALSRLAVAAHWPSDVLVGAGLGLLAAALAAGLARWRVTRAVHEGLVRRIRSPRGQKAVVLAEFACAAGLLAERTGYPAGRPTVALLAGMACVSAAWRWQGLMRDAGTRLPSAARSP